METKPPGAMVQNPQVRLLEPQVGSVDEVLTVAPSVAMATSAWQPGAGSASRRMAQFGWQEALPQVVKLSCSRTRAALAVPKLRATSVKVTVPLPVLTGVVVSLSTTTSGAGTPRYAKSSAMLPSPAGALIVPPALTVKLTRLS